jgi:hypothetical protein
MTKYQIELTAPDDLDPSTLLERAQELAVELAEEYQDEDSDELDEDAKEAIRNDVSVTDVTAPATSLSRVLADAALARTRPALSRWTVLYTRCPTNYNDQQRMIVDAEDADAARELVNERLGDRGKQISTYYIESVKPYKPVASAGHVVEGGR